MLYIVATPIGNLADITFRAVDVLNEVDVILAEDTRQTKKLVQHYAIDTPLRAFHEHNEVVKTAEVVAQLSSGQTFALVSDAGTPLISDPGYQLVSACQKAGIKVVPVPGASAVMAALSVSGLPTDQFKFIGFLPSKSGHRQKRLAEFVQEPATLVLFESTHRIMSCLEDIKSVLGADKQIVVAKELTKQHENVIAGTVAHCLSCLEEKAELQKGEFVVLVSKHVVVEQSDAALISLLQPLMKVLPLKQAAATAAEISGEKKNKLYQMALNLRDSD